MGTLILFSGVNHLLSLKKLLLEEVGNLKLLPPHLRGSQLLGQIATLQVEDSVGKRCQKGLKLLKLKHGGMLKSLKKKKNILPVLLAELLII